MNGRGILLVVDGPEGAGKSTQVARIGALLEARGAEHVELREPGGTALGDRIRSILLDPSTEMTARAEAALFMASRAELVSEVVRPALARGAVVTLDRFFLSTYAYQVHGRGLPETQVREANALAVDGLVPDLTILLQLSFEAGLQRADRRGGRDRIEVAGDDFHRKVEQAFALFATQPWQAEHPECGPIAAVDATGKAGEVTNRIMQVLASRWPGVFIS
ncbi:MAG TPA: dTMP kinase [Gemmatimonadaceae bacterium]|nr:dTMP kinase [Gemmatimonadaceae bacterium]